MPWGGPLPVVVAALLLLVPGAPAAAAAAARTDDDRLSCHQCNVTDNSQCGPALPCPADQAYDRCTTTLRKRDDGPMRIIKGCTLGKCFLDSGATTALGLDRCDTSRPNFDCVFCCEGDGCNVSAAPESGGVPSTLVVTVSFALFLSQAI